MSVVRINDRTVGDASPCYIVAELSANHSHDFDRAVRLLHAAREAGADAIKVQTYTADTLTIDCAREYFRIGEGTAWAGIVSLGGLMGAYEDERYPWLRAEKRLLADAVSADVPVLGLCLGCQMLADALGGRAYRAPTPELGMLEVDLTDAGRVDPVLRHLDVPVPVWHSDTWELPPGGELLASTPAHPHAFRLGSGVGDPSARAPWHNPGYLVSPAAIPVGAMTLAAATLELMEAAGA